MAGSQEVRAFEVTCPPNTAADNPQITDLNMPVRTALSIRVRIPSGPLSSMGFQLAMANTPIIPFNDDTFVIADDETFEWDNQGWPNSGAWQAIMYNVGQYPHTIYIYFTVELPDTPAAASTAQFLPIQSLGPPASSIPAVPPPPTLDPLQLVDT